MVSGISSSTADIRHTAACGILAFVLNLVAKFMHKHVLVNYLLIIIKINYMD